VGRDIQRLVILGGSATGLAVARSAHALGLPAIVADTRRSLATYSRCGTFHLLPSEASELAFEELMTLADDVPTAIVADSDSWLRFLQGWREELDEAFTVLHAPRPVLATCLDKERFSLWCERNQIPAPRYRPITGGTEGASDRFPVIVRPRLTCHHRAQDVPKAIECRTPAELQWAIELFRRINVDPHISDSLLRPGTRCFSVGLARRGDGEILSLTAERLRPLPEQCSAGTYVRLAPLPQVQELAERVAEKLDLFGIAEVEVVSDRDVTELSVIEVNARPWLQFPLADRSGHAMLSFLLGRPVKTPRAREVDGIRWLDTTADRYICFSRQRGLVWDGKVRTLDWFRAALGAETHPVWSWSDPGPLLHSLLGGWRPR